MVSELEKVQSQIKEVQKDVSRKILFVLKRIVHLDQNRGHESCLHGLVYVHMCVRALVHGASGLRFHPCHPDPH